MSVAVVGVVAFPLLCLGDATSRSSDVAALDIHEPWLSALAGGLLGAALLGAMPALLPQAGAKTAAARRPDPADSHVKQERVAGAEPGTLGTVVAAALLLTTVAALRQSDEGNEATQPDGPRCEGEREHLR
jgi:hypothetical protein